MFNWNFKNNLRCLRKIANFEKYRILKCDFLNNIFASEFCEFCATLNLISIDNSAKLFLKNVKQVEKFNGFLQVDLRVVSKSHKLNPTRAPFAKFIARDLRESFYFSSAANIFRRREFRAANFEKMSFICRIAPAFIENAQFSGFVLENGNCTNRRINECLLGTHSCDVNAQCLCNCSNCICKFLFQIKTRKTA